MRMQKRHPSWIGISPLRLNVPDEDYCFAAFNASATRATHAPRKYGGM